jgi:hypothetical protein
VNHFPTVDVRIQELARTSVHTLESGMEVFERCNAHRRLKPLGTFADDKVIAAIAYFISG